MVKGLEWMVRRRTPDGTAKVMQRGPDEWVGGVASGIANYFDIDPVYLRVLFLIGLFLGGLSLPLYGLLWLIMPKPQR